MKQISVIIPIRGRNDRLYEIINRLDHDIVGEVIIVDYCSDEPIKFHNEYSRIVRYDKHGPWNKAHAINIGVKSAKFDYIMTLDADILLGPSFLDKLKSKLSLDAFIYTNKVKRIKKEDLRTIWKTNMQKSFPWHQNTNIRTEAFNLATGGFQCFPKKWFERIKGLDENLVYYGGMDNITIIDARNTGMNLIILNETILHLEHENQKEMNLPKDERKFATYVKSTRWELMEYITSPGYIKPDNYGSMEGPNCPLVDKYRNIFEQIKHEIPDSEDTVEFDRDTKIMIAVINNKSTLPERFVRSLMAMHIHTKNIFPNTDIKFVRSCQVNNMRNMAVMDAINGGYDYLICLDDDHEYPVDSIPRLMCHQQDFVTGCTRQRIAPYNPTQFYKFKMPMKQESNFVRCTGEDGLIKIECSGPVGMLMKVSALMKLDYPYYWMDYSNAEYVLKRNTTEDWTFYPEFVSNYVGGDYVFARQLLEKGFDLYLDSSIDFPHMISGVVDAISEDGSANVRLDDGAT